MKELFDSVSRKCSKAITAHYSTSFSIGIRLLSKRLRQHVYAIYGYVRLGDEIVDTFHEHDKKSLLEKFKRETHEAIKQGISLNPIINSFQLTVNQYNIDTYLIDTFIDSMEMDLSQKTYGEDDFKKYILGSAEVVGLMCLKVFCEGNEKQFESLKLYAMQLGAAFQKINFLRDLKADYHALGRSYFPDIDLSDFDETTKEQIEKNIAEDLHEAYKGIKKLPKAARFGVYLAYVYYTSLFRKIKRTSPTQILKERVRIPNNRKYMLLITSYVKHSFNLI